VTWLFEPRRSEHTVKHSGSLQHPQLTGRPGHTINAFQHFIYQFTQKTQVLADIQSSASWDHNNCSPVRFDLMMHTIYQNMGAGDFGEHGITSFIDQHICVPRCTSLGFTAIKE
ncbi:hypothetical protein C8J56DRAFT_728404, partial [Mycena floridula]